MVADPAEAVLNRTWRPALSVIGAEGLPPIASAGNVLRPQTSLKLSLRLPPTLDGDQGDRRPQAPVRDRSAGAAPPSRSRADQGASGWNAPPTAPWLAQALAEASQAFFGKPVAAMGEGGTIPFMAMLGGISPTRSS